MGKDDLRFGDRNGGGGGGQGDLPPEAEFILRAIVFLILGYAFLSVLNTLVLDGALPLLL